MLAGCRERPPLAQVSMRIGSPVKRASERFPVTTPASMKVLGLRDCSVLKEIGGTLDRHRGAGWTPAYTMGMLPSAGRDPTRPYRRYDPTNPSWSSAGLRLSARETLVVPHDIAPGEYRLRKEIAQASGCDPGDRPPSRVLSYRFRVVAR
jgi:hypothetical protein